MEILNLYKARRAAGYSHESVMESIYARGRDNARTPMQWTDGPNAGFTQGKPWLRVNENHSFINARAEMENPDSVFHYYKKLIALRKEYAVFRDGRFTLVSPDHEQVFAYTRDTENGHMLVVCNFTAEHIPFPRPRNYRDARKLIANYPGDCDTLRPYEAYIYYYEEHKE